MGSQIGSLTVFYLAQGALSKIRGCFSIPGLLVEIIEYISLSMNICLSMLHNIDLLK